MFWVGSDDADRLGRRLEQDVVDERLVLESDRRDWRRHGEDDMEIGNRQQFGAAICKPLEARETLALRAMSIAAGIVGDADLAAILAPLDMTAERRRSACLDRGHDLALIEGEPVALRSAKRIAVAAEMSATSSFERMRAGYSGGINWHESRSKGHGVLAIRFVATCA